MTELAATRGALRCFLRAPSPACFLANKKTCRLFFGVVYHPALRAKSDTDIIRDARRKALTSGLPPAHDEEERAQGSRMVTDELAGRGAIQEADAQVSPARIFCTSLDLGVYAFTTCFPFFSILRLLALRINAVSGCLQLGGASFGTCILCMSK